jgi:peptidoglycan/xylan/chitin deacetylase (PgdA/CDA1 family)
MKPYRVLLISNVRPSRARTFANRITREISGITICGIVQQPLRSLPGIQQVVARQETRESVASSGWLSKTAHFLYSISTKLFGCLLWLIHGFPIGLDRAKTYTIKRLREECAGEGWPFVVSADATLGTALNSLGVDQPDLVILLGELPSIQGLPLNPSNGFIRARCPGIETGASQPKTSTLICIEHLTSDSKLPSSIASVELPWQPYDGLLGFTLKTDLIADDLLLQTVAGLRTGDVASTSTLVQQWSKRILEPCLRQLQPVDYVTSQNGHVSKYCRTKRKLCLDTLLLCSPWILLRNCFRRWRKQYPVLILAHHLVSDRPHRMGMSTELFLELVLYLQEHYRIVSLSQAVELLRSGEVRVPTVALTFDDGYADNFLNLRAVANETGIPATLFITTHPVETHKEFGHDLINGMTGFLPLTWDQVQYWSTRGVEFGSHTRTHMDCGTPDPAKLQSEIIGSKDDLEAQLGKSVGLFAFPYGQPENMCSEAMKLAASTYSYFVSSFGGEAPAQVKNLRSHLFRKNFYPSQWELELELQSVFDVSAAIRRLLSFREGKGAAKKTEYHWLPS